jgi:hypothetical protein
MSARRSRQMPLFGCAVSGSGAPEIRHDIAETSSMGCDNLSLWPDKIKNKRSISMAYEVLYTAY